MTPGMECMLAVLRGNVHEQASTPTDDSLLAALRLSEEERIQPFFIARLRQAGIPISATLAEVLTAAERSAAQSGFWWSSELKGLLSAFSAAGICVVPLKGPSLALRLYGSVTARPCRDLDLLVRAKDFEAAGVLLQQLGFTAGEMGDYHQGWKRGTTTVELHFDIENPLRFDLEMDAVWSRTQSADFLGVPIMLFAPEDEFAFLCLHGVRHCYERLSYVLDATFALEHLPLAVRSKTMRPPKDLVSAVQLGQAMVRRLGLANDTGIFHTEPVPHIEKVADTVWSQRMEGIEAPSSWFGVHRFYRQLEPSPARRFLLRVRHLRIVMGLLRNPNVIFTTRFGLRSPSTVRLLRRVQSIGLSIYNKRKKQGSKALQVL